LQGDKDRLVQAKTGNSGNRSPTIHCDPPHLVDLSASGDRTPFRHRNPHMSSVMDTTRSLVSTNYFRGDTLSSAERIGLAHQRQELLTGCFQQGES